MRQTATIAEALTPEQIGLARSLFGEYAAWLGIDLSFQGFSGELSNLPGVYAPPSGCLLLAWVNGEVAGCGALRALDETTGEMKRLFVRPAFRAQGVGRQLAERIVREAQAIGYRVIRLDTLSHMQSAIRLYETLGFTRRAAYYATPLPNTVFMELRF